MWTIYKTNKPLCATGFDMPILMLVVSCTLFLSS